MKFIIDILRGMVIGLANIIPGVSGGTMMVSMGIYDTLIHCITNLFKQFKKSVMTLLPYAVGMVLAIALGAFGLKAAFAKFALPTNALFIGLIIGSVPMILKQMKGSKKGMPGVVIFLLFFAAVVLLKVFENPNNKVGVTVNLWSIILLFLLGCISSATMVIPGVSGSMILKTLGYYEPIVTDGITGFLSALKAGNMDGILQGIGMLLPFGIGIVVGIFAIAKLIEVLLRKWKGLTYCAILGMVLASPVAILMAGEIYAGVNAWIIVASVVTFALGLLVAWKLGGDPEKA
ncbi:MAG: DUF368 domain-containing protein [Clostridia bacterium]|nr:DUF368 domain-containing protein [Clostridia bacterium]